MKLANPFLLEGGVIGRKDALQSYNGFLSSEGEQRILAITGEEGMGKSVFLKECKREAERKGFEAAYVRAEKGETEQDLAGKILGEVGKGGKAQDFAAIANTLKRAAAKKEGLAVIIDDFDNAKKVEALLRSLSKVAIGHVCYIIGARSDPVGVRSIHLPPFDRHDAEDFVERALKESRIRMGDECLQSILSDSSGNPRIFKAICREVYDNLKENDKLISKADYLSSLPRIMAGLSIDWFGRIYNETPASERVILHAIAKNQGSHVSDIAKAIGKPLGPTTALVGRLLKRGQLIRMDRGKYRVFATLYANYVLQRGFSG